MIQAAKEFWRRAIVTLSAANMLLRIDSDGATSRAYYAAFYAVSALFATEDKTFKKHSAIDAAVHRELIKTKRWPKELGEAFSSLLDTRTTADYGCEFHVDEDRAGQALEFARRILEAVHKENPDMFPAGWEK